MDKKLIAEARARLYSGVISDVLDGLGNMQHAMAPIVRPLDESLVLFGRARTGLYMPRLSGRARRSTPTSTRSRWSTTSSPTTSPCSPARPATASDPGASC